MRSRDRIGECHGRGRVPLLVLLVTLSSGPALAQVDITGLWRQLSRNEDGNGMVGDAAGLPISAAGRWRGDGWSPDDFDVAEWVCRPHAWDFSLEGVLSQMHTRWRRIGDYLQATVIIYDPVYLAEPYIRSTMMWVNDPALPMAPYPCEEATETAVARGTVPHFLPGESRLPGRNPRITDRFGTPYEARLGGPETMYPEYIAKMKTFPRPAAVATGTSEGTIP